MSVCIVPIHETSLKALRFGMHCHGISSRMSHTCLCRSQPQLVLIYQPRRDGRLSRPWWEVAAAEIRTCNLPITSPVLYHAATSAPNCYVVQDLCYRQQTSALQAILDAGNGDTSDAANRYRYPYSVMSLDDRERLGQ